MSRTRIVGFGVDSLDLFSRARVSAAEVVRLRSLRGSALKRRLAEVVYAGIVFNVAARRGRHSALLLRNENMTLAVRPNACGFAPRVAIGLRAMFLARVGPDAAVAAAQAIVQQLVGPQVPAPPLHVSRIDLAADLQGWVVKPGHLKRFKTLAKRVREFDSAGRFTGFQFGQEARVARVYDKTAEIEASGKRWAADAWSRSDRYRPGDPVWRIEFQLRREALRSRKRAGDRAPLDTWEQVRSGIGTLWRELTSRWLSVRLPRTRKIRRRYARKWQPIMAEPFQGAARAGAHEPLQLVVARTEARSNDAALDREIVRAIALRKWAGDEREIPVLARSVADDAVARFIALGRRGRAAVSRHLARFRSAARPPASVVAVGTEGGTDGDEHGEHVRRRGGGERLAHGRGGDGLPAASEPGCPLPGGEPGTAPRPSNGAASSLPACRVGGAARGSVAPALPAAVGSGPACVVGGGP